jgi:hypothetical protein
MTIHGPADQVRAIVNAVRPAAHEDGLEDKDENPTFTKFMPQPRDEQGDLVDGTSWQYDNWGTKWGDCDTDITYENYESVASDRPGEIGSASLTYRTAWGPMTGLVKEISRLHPDVTIDIEYEEPGMSFFGIEQFRGGDIVHERHHEYDFSSGKIQLEDGWEVHFDTDWDDEDQDPSGTLSDAIVNAVEHMWTERSLAETSALADYGAVGYGASIETGALADYRAVDYGASIEAGAPVDEGAVDSRTLPDTGAGAPADEGIVSS